MHKTPCNEGQLFLCALNAQALTLHIQDGRTKLKLELLGLSVDKCGICLAQMRDGEAGARAEDCKHAFHEKCLRRWLAQRGTCPNCREPLQMEEQ
ncbi:hypothetical protein PENSPDRAFT_585373 [Peniophora sp. CONT]|nr:hypothetical protein PENSPDRAFT_585373 [Peniophora sp. CONT]